MTNITRQQEMALDIINLISTISTQGFGIDIVNNPLTAGRFRDQFARFAPIIDQFILKYCPMEPTSTVVQPTPNVQPVQEVPQEQPNNDVTTPGSQATSKQSGVIITG